MKQQKLGKISLKTLSLVIGVVSALSNHGFSAEKAEKAKEQNRAPQAVDPKPTAQSAAEVAPPVSREEMRDHVSLALVGSENIAQNNYEIKTKFGNGGAKTGGKMKPGVGLLLNLPFNSGSNVVISNEALLGYNGREGSMSNLTEGSRWIKFSNLIRVSPLSFLSVGLGPYAAKGVGQVRYSRNGSSQDLSFAEAGYKSFDYGLEGAIGARLDLTRRLGIIADGRYSMGFANLMREPKRSVLGVEIEESTKTNEATILLGLSLNLN